MKQSPIQLLQLFFKHVRVEVDPQRMPPEPHNPLNSAFLFDGIKIHTEFGVGEVDPDHERGRMFLTNLRVVVDNHPGLDGADEKYSPYRIDVLAEGVIVAPPGAETFGDVDDLVAVNGAALLWSAIREQVHALTSRMPVGPVMLPTVHFHDLKKSTISNTSDPNISVKDVVRTTKPAARKRALTKSSN